MKKMLLAVFLMVLYCLGYSQGTIRGKLVDSSSKKGLGLATITVFKASDTSLVTYRLSNPEGEFKVPGLLLQIPLRVVISYTGYAAFRKEFTLTGNETLDLGNI